MRYIMLGEGYRWSHEDGPPSDMPYEYHFGVLALVQETTTGRVEVQQGWHAYIPFQGEWLGLDKGDLRDYLARHPLQVWYGRSVPDEVFQRVLREAINLRAEWEES